MQKSSTVLLIAGGLVVGGLALSAWANQVIFEDLAAGGGSIAAGERVTVQTSMEESEKGVFVVEAPGPKGDAIFATVTDPFGSQLAREAVGREAFEGHFDADAAGEYTLTIENSGGADAVVTGYIGPEPDASKRSIAFVSIYVLIVGLVCMAAAIVYSAFKRGRRQLR